MPRTGVRVEGLHQHVSITIIQHVQSERAGENLTHDSLRTPGTDCSDGKRDRMKDVRGRRNQRLPPSYLPLNQGCILDCK